MDIAIYYVKINHEIMVAQFYKMILKFLTFK